MKLATVLTERSDLQRRIAELSRRLEHNAMVQEGDTPAEEPAAIMATEEVSPQGGNLSPLLANIYLDEFDHEFQKRGVPCIRYADDVVLLAKSKRASERFLETATSYLENKLKLKVNRDKSRTVSVFAIRNFKLLGFALGRKGTGIYVRVHPKSWKKYICFESDNVLSIRIGKWERLCSLFSL